MRKSCSSSHFGAAHYTAAALGPAKWRTPAHSIGRVAEAVVLVYAATACATAPEPTDAPELQTAVAGTVEALAWNSIDTAAAPTATSTPTASPTPTNTATPTRTPTPTPAIVTLTLLVNTWCRATTAGGSTALGLVEAGETVRVVGLSTYSNYWYVANPDRPGEDCWVWGGDAGAIGDLAPLPVLTPAVTPRPLISVAASFFGFQTCGGLHAIFTVQNTGRTKFMTAQRYVRDLDTHGTVFSAELDRHPFAPRAPECPPDHSNILEPGDVKYIFVPIDDVPHGHQAEASLKMCTQDYLGGDCRTVKVTFRFPD